LAALSLLAGCGGGGGGGGGDGAPATSGGVEPPSLATTAGTDMGVNLQTGGGTPAANDRIASTMASRGFKLARLDYVINSDTTMLRDQITRIVQNGGKVQLVLQNSYQWDHSCNQDLTGVEQDSYDQAHAMVGAMKDLVRDYEILNEIQLRPDMAGEVEPDRQGSSTTGFDDSPCAHSLAAVARGIARAVQAHGQRVILGAVGRDWGFLTFMREQGVTWDVTGYHTYPRADSPSLLSDAWYGAGGPLAQLAEFGKPVTINEFNCGEIYQPSYENQAGRPVTEACLASITEHMTELRNQEFVELESIIAYQLLDQPANRAPENRFGLMYTLDSPKPALYLLSAFAGGSLAAVEQQAITSRGLLTEAEIARMR
jgi:hypothetical protein